MEMVFILSWLDKSSMTYRNKIIETDTDKKAINMAKKHLESMPFGSWDKPFLGESKDNNLKYRRGL